MQRNLCLGISINLTQKFFHVLIVWVFITVILLTVWCTKLMFNAEQQELKYDEFSKAAASLVRRVKLPDAKMQAVPSVLEDIERALAMHWPGCRTFNFGSSDIGVALQHSDVDIFVKLNDTSIKTSTEAIIEEAKSILEQHSALFKNFSTVLKVPVPIVKFQHIPSGLLVDVNLKSEVVVRNSKIFRYLLQRDERVLDLAIIVKHWARLLKVTKHRGFSSTAMTVLLIFYLQQLDILPSVRSLQENATPYIVETWNTGFEESDYKSQDSHSLYELLGGFFEYYSSFEFDKNIISPFLGRPVKRQLFDNLDTVPHEFEFYKRNVGLNLKQPFSCVHICIQEPFSHDQNNGDSKIGSALELSAQFKQAAYKYRETSKTKFLDEILTPSPEF